MTLQPRQIKLLHTLRSKGVTSEPVLRAITQVPREQFLSPALRVEAYEDKALPIGENQTISMPSVVGAMTQALDIQPTEKILEIGTGCGYQLAVLCKLARRVFSVERFVTLSASANKRLQILNISNYITMVGDGAKGWPQQAPFDKIIVTAAARIMPEPLLEQLRPGGILVLPIGESEHQQSLVKCTKNADGSIGYEDLGKVAFVPLVSPEQQGRAKAS